MMTKSDADEQKTSRYRISKKKQTQPIYEMVPCYEEAVIMGDSLAESILDFRLLRKHNVVAKRNRCIDSIQGDLLFAISMQPSVIFMEYGKNDMLRSGKDLNAFIACYRRQIQMLQSALPQTAVYINSILPLRRDVMRRNGGEHRYHSYNRALKDMCDALQLTFIDNSSLMDGRMRSMSMMAYTRSIPIIRNGSGIWLPVRVCYRKNRIDRGFYASYIKESAEAKKKRCR